MDYIQLSFYMKTIEWVSAFLFIGWWVIWVILEDWDQSTSREKNERH